VRDDASEAQSMVILNMLSHKIFLKMDAVKAEFNNFSVTKFYAVIQARD